MTTNYKDVPELYEYIQLVEKSGKNGFKKVSVWQQKLVKYVKNVFENEDLTVDSEQLSKYMGLQKYFPFRLLPWEKFVFTLHNCTYRRDGLPRFPDLFMFVGRGAGKNGYMAFEGFSLISPYNHVREYDVDICAMSESQAKTSFMDVYNVLENKKYKKKLRRFFYWNKEVIIGKKNNSKLKYHTNNNKTKDGLRSGAVYFDEVHAYQSYNNIKVFVTGLGKKPHPRRTYASTNGDVCDGVLDDLVEKSKKILNGDMADNGMLPFMCMLDDPKEVDDKGNWHKANPSLQYFPSLMEETSKEYAEWKENVSTASDFMTKRMNVRQGNGEVEITSWENILATNQELPATIKGEIAVAGIDYTKIDDFASAGILTKRDGKFVWVQKTWICTNSADLPRVNKKLLAAAEAAGEIEYVDDIEISPDLIAGWLKEQMRVYSIKMLCLDNYRLELIQRALEKIGFSYRGGNIYIIRPSDKIKIEPVIDSAFRNHNIIFGDSPIMRWYTNNTKKEMSKKYGNYEYKKIEAKSRKTDGFFAFVAAMAKHELIPEARPSKGLPEIFIL